MECKSEDKDQIKNAKSSVNLLQHQLPTRSGYVSSPQSKKAEKSIFMNDDDYQIFLNKETLNIAKHRDRDYAMDFNASKHRDYAIDLNATKHRDSTIDLNTEKNTSNSSPLSLHKTNINSRIVNKDSLEMSQKNKINDEHNEIDQLKQKISQYIHNICCTEINSLSRKSIRRRHKFSLDSRGEMMLYKFASPLKKVITQSKEITQSTD